MPELRSQEIRTLTQSRYCRPSLAWYRSSTNLLFLKWCGIGLRSSGTKEVKKYLLPLTISIHSSSVGQIRLSLQNNSIPWPRCRLSISSNVHIKAVSDWESNRSPCWLQIKWNVLKRTSDETLEITGARRRWGRGCIREIVVGLNHIAKFEEFLIGQEVHVICTVDSLRNTIDFVCDCQGRYERYV